MAEPKDLIRALRKRLGLTQEEVSAGSAGRLGRLDVVKLENGQNQGTSDRARAGLAEAFGVPQANLSAYLDGKIDLEELMRRREHTPDELRVPRGLLHAFVIQRGRFDEAALVHVASIYREEPPEGWTEALVKAQRFIGRQTRKKSSRPPPDDRRGPGRTTGVHRRGPKAANDDD